MITKDCTVMMAHAGTWSWAPLQMWGLQGLYGDSGESTRKAHEIKWDLRLYGEKPSTLVVCIFFSIITRSPYKP